jgi:glutamyl-tRNA synthetase
MLSTELTRSRIAPTPSGFLHLGNAYNFLLTEELVRKDGGSLRLRIDDLDAARVRTEYLEDIFESLKWLDIDWHEGPKSMADADEHSQILRVASYDTALEELVKSGRVFACECSRSQLQQVSKDGQYPGTCREKGIPLDQPGVSWRFRTRQDEVVNWSDEILGAVEIDLFSENRDFVIRRRDGIPAYHVASLCDDVDYGVNLIVRGQDLLTSTAAQRALAAALGWEPFLQTKCYHHPLMLDEQGEKLSKSAGSRSLKTLREAGRSSHEVQEAAWKWFEGFL